jgi:phosphoglycerate dehydrogenase-like enzyme
VIQLVFCGSGWLSIVDAIRERLPSDATIRIWDRSRPLPVELADAHVILPSNATVDAAAIAAARDLRLIQQPAVGTEKIDLAAARTRGVPVCNVPAANSAAVAEAALFLILALARRLPRARRAFAQARVGEPLGFELDGGRSAVRLADAARALGMHVSSVRSTSTRDDFFDLLSRADVVSVHCPLTDRTRHLFDAQAFARLKRGAILVNCARGGIVDRHALEGALDRGDLAGVGLDTFWQEPWDPSDPLFARDDVVTMPHIGGATVEAFARVADAVVDNVRRISSGEPLLHRVA